MTMLKALVLPLILLAPNAATQLGPERNSAQPVVVPYCELVQNPEAYKGRLVRTTAILMTDNVELQVLTDPQCRDDGRNDSWVEWLFSDRFGASEPYRALWGLIRLDGVAEVTVLGYFAGPREDVVPPAWIKDRKTAEKWALMEGRYGHLHHYRFLFQVIDVVSVKKVKLEPS